jgi:hypothetical protein
MAFIHSLSLKEIVEIAIGVFLGMLLTQLFNRIITMLFK